MGVTIGLIGNTIKYEPKKIRLEVDCPHCKLDPGHKHEHRNKTVKERLVSAMKYACVDLPKEIGLELLIGILLAALVATFVPIGNLIKAYLGGWFGYAFAIIFGVLTYICSTATVPLVDSLIRQGMNSGAAMTLLLIGPVTSYGTLLVLKKEYGVRVLAIFLVTLIAISLMLGLGFHAVKSL
jgi:uncharacterized protein